MKKLLLLLATVALGTLIFVSCSEDSPTNVPVNTPTSNEYFVSKMGSEWQYTNYELDDAGNKVTSSEYMTKTVITDSTEKGGKMTMIFQNQNMDGSKIDNEYYYSTPTQIFTFSQLLPDLDFELPVDIPEDWYKIGDEKDTTWTLFTQALDSADFSFGGYDIILNDDIVVTVKNLGTETIQYGANSEMSVLVRKYQTSFAYGGSSYVKNLPLPGMLTPIDIPFSADYIWYWGKNIGLVKLEVKPLIISAFGFELLNLAGSEQLLINYLPAE